MTIQETGNFIFNQNPGKYGNRQTEFVQESQKKVEEALPLILNAIEERIDLTELFYRILELFGNSRHELAVRHGTDKKEEFGRKRQEVIPQISYTPLGGEYEIFNKKILSFFKKILGSSIPIKGSITNKSFSVKETHLGRSCSFTIELFTSKEIQELHWNKDLPPNIEETKRNISFPTEEINKIDMSHFPPTKEEKETLAAYNKQLQSVKQIYPEVYLHGKMSFMLKKLFFKFPPPKKIIDSNGKFLGLEGEAYNLKSIYLIGKARIQIGNKMYALSEYLTWSYQDHATNPVERMQHSKIIILHQDRFLIDDTLKEIASIFEKTLLLKNAKENVEELKDSVALIRYLFAHAMVFARGSAWTGEQIEKLLYRFHGFQCRHSQKTMGDMEALTAPLWSTFRKNYDSTIILSPL